MKSALECSDSDSPANSSDSEHTSGVLLPLTFQGAAVQKKTHPESEDHDTHKISHSSLYRQLPKAPKTSKATTWVGEGSSRKDQYVETDIFIPCSRTHLASEPHRLEKPVVYSPEPATKSSDIPTTPLARSPQNNTTAALNPAPFPEISPLRHEVLQTLQTAPSQPSPVSPLMLSEGSEDERDPTKLCPFCDEPLPDNPSSLLTNLINKARLKARRDPRPRNPLGLIVAFAVRANACARHSWECKQLPLAEKEGWPTEIDWEKVHERIIDMQGDLESILLDSVICESVEYKGGSDEELHSVRESSVFWTRAIKTIAENGTLVGGVHGALANFDSVNPGYYGEIGYVLISDTLKEMFPDIRDFIIHPLYAEEFFKYVLIPEVAIRLIMEDQKLVGPEGMATAADIMKKSWIYGVGIFPTQENIAIGAKTKQRRV
ncbi:mitogen activated protein kinase [Stygiomarasmius scandens]|uniref:Restriction of telomere capping protein 4 n=1 Tax=Marasmiellus scandens TaxID=2682957 RepID=A0ABR1IKL2_9AGAR